MPKDELFLWKFTPVARPDDPTWQGRDIWSNYQIVAATAGEAILLASRSDEQEKGRSVEASQDRQQLRSGFEDPLLYRLDRIDAVDPNKLSRGTVVATERLSAAAR
jgi:hypothetical protein